MFYPTYHFEKAADIPIAFLQKNNIRALILDVDNTLTTDGSQTPAEGIVVWLEKLRAAGISAVILSNNTEKRVEPFAKMLGLPFVPNAKKPFLGGIKLAQCLLSRERGEIALVGDQLLTDILGGCRFKIKTILVDPLGRYEMWPIRIKRFVEQWILLYYKHRGLAEYER